MVVVIVVVGVVIIHVVVVCVVIFCRAHSCASYSILIKAISDGFSAAHVLGNAANET